jgi:uncharacterized protein (TIGR00725 family)
MMQNPLIVGVMGGRSVDKETAQNAYQLGVLIASRGWILLNGGRNAGVMAASAKGARENGGSISTRMSARVNHRISLFAAKPGRSSDLLDG